MPVVHPHSRVLGEGSANLSNLAWGGAGPAVGEFHLFPWPVDLASALGAVGGPEVDPVGGRTCP
eukprot:1089599-Pyramimonas_sp.AAC.1